MLRQRIFDLLLGALAGILLAGALSTVCYDKKLRAVQTFAHEVTDSAGRIVAHANDRADSLERRADSIAEEKRVVVTHVEQDTISAAVAARSLLTARTARDSNVALRLENQALRQAVGGLFVALHQAEQIIALEHARGDSLRKALGDVNLQLRSLNARVQDLKPPPKIVTIGMRVVEIAAAGWIGYQIGNKDERSTIEPTHTASVCATPPYRPPCRH